MSGTLHEGWLAGWEPALADPGLRDALMGSRRFALRIERDLLSAAGVGTSLDALRAGEHVVVGRLERITDEALLRAGLLWFAPVLARSLKPLASLADVEPRRERLAIVMDGRGHAAAGLVTEPATAADVVAEGRHCLAAWLRAEPAPVSARLRLRLDPAISAIEVDRASEAVRATAMRASLASLEAGK